MADALHLQALNAFRDAIAALSLNGIDNRISVEWGITAQWAATTRFPCILVTPSGVESIVGGTNLSDDWSRPVTVLVVDRISDANLAPINEVLTWRQQIAKAFATKRLTGVTDVYKVEIQGSPVVDIKLLEYQLLASPLVFAVTSREARP